MNKPNFSKENLENLIEILKLLIEIEENEWFKDRLHKEVFLKYYPLCPTTDAKGLLKDEEVSRIRAYMHLIDKKYLNYGGIFYKKIKDQALRKELIADFRNMKIAQKNDDIISFGRYMGLQLENCYNFVLNKIDVWSKILQDPQYYKAIPSKIHGKPPIDFYNSFISFDRNTKRETNKKIEGISLPTRAFFCHIEYGYSLNPNKISDIYFLRNIGSHRGQLSVSDESRLQTILQGFDKNSSAYYSNFEAIVNGLTDLY
jgi:hypothetical protein